MNLTTDQQIRLELFREFRDDAQKAFNFIFPTILVPSTESEEPYSGALAEGVHIRYEDGHLEYFDGTNSKEGVSHLSIKCGLFFIGLQLRDKGSYQLLKDGVRCPEDAPHYTRGKRNAFTDWDFKENTERIKVLGTDIPLEEGEYIPSLGQWGILMQFAEDIQKALEYVGGEPLTDEDWYWSSTELSQLNAWLVYFNDGYTGTYYKYGSSRVRAVVAF